MQAPRAGDRPPADRAAAAARRSRSATVVEPVAGAATGAARRGGRAGRRGAADRRAQADAGRLRRASRTSRPVSAGDGVNQATALPNGIALPPLEAPEAVRQMIEAGNLIARTPYLWGGGHGKWVDKGYDCSGSVSFVLASAGFLESPLASGPLMSWGEPGPGKWVTIYTQPGPRLHGGRGDPLRHLGPRRSPARAGRTSCAPTRASSRGIRRVSEPTFRSRPALKRREHERDREISTCAS